MHDRRRRRRRVCGWLGDEVLLGDRDGVSAYRRSDCSPVAAGGHCAGRNIVVAPGVVLIVDAAPGAITVTGYS